VSARLTVHGSERLEADLARVLARIADVTRLVVPGESLRALVLIGGYGRGEGGVDRSTGAERPHNNLDLLLVTRHVPVVGPLLARRHGRELAEAAQPIGRCAGVGIDVGAITDEELASARCLVMWSDMRQGHRVVAGDPRFVDGLSRFHPGSIAADDVLALLVNRATLLLLNRALIAAEIDARRTIVKHAMKAVVGAGDALLYAHGLYDGSYVVKRRRIAELGDAPAELRDWYDRAIAFRLEPDYARFPCDLAAWNADLLALVAGVHRRFEAERLGRTIGPDWDGYVAAAVAAAEATGPRSLRDRARLARDRRQIGALGRIGWREAVPVLFPLVAYRADPALAGRLLKAPSTDETTLDRAYLDAWGRHCDPAYERVRIELGLAAGGPSP
jgi:hypothetical protein